MVAGPNGSGKTTLMRRLIVDYAVNFYDILNADDIFAEVKQTGCYLPRISIDQAGLESYAFKSSYSAEVRAAFTEGKITVNEDCVRFVSQDAVNSYTIALLTNFLQSEYIAQGKSFSQETVFSHPSKLNALQAAKNAGFRTYLYFVSTDFPEINVSRVTNRAAQGGHDVPIDKINSRYKRSLEQLPKAMPYLSRLFLFDNSGDVMRYIAEWNPETGFSLAHGAVVPKCYSELISN